MARIRSVHPGIYTDEAVASVSIAARWLLTGLWVNADDGGGFAWKPVTLKMSIFPGDNVDVSPLLDELERQNIIKKYEFEGRQYGAIRNFGQFQSPRKPNRTAPMPAELRKFCCSEHVLTKQEASQDDKKQNQGEFKEGQYGKSPNSQALKGGEFRKSPNREPLNEGQYGIGDGEGEGIGEDISSLRSDTPYSPPTPKKTDPRGTRLPEDWEPTDEMRSYALSLNLNPTDVGENFRDYWVSAAGAKARKADWTATWRGWCRREAERKRGAIAPVKTIPQTRQDRVHDAWAGVPTIPGV
ncbi:MAG: hypothetical protein ABF443_14225 [Acetobacter malorum]|uniref:hypothetical protein n=1 Tax=Acetobacter malorum TaxID=178901 RepID=UPI0039ED4736